MPRNIPFRAVLDLGTAFANEFVSTVPYPTRLASRALVNESSPQRMRICYNSNVIWATGWPHRSGTGSGEAESCPLVRNDKFHFPAAHPAIAQTALHNSKHDVQMKYWSYLAQNDMIASCASHLGRHLVSMYSALGLTRASFECMEKGSCAPLSCSQGGLGS